MLTMSDDEGDLYHAIKAGASGYLLKDMPIDEVASSIRPRTEAVVYAVREKLLEIT
jgi:hypothetical protein